MHAQRSILAQWNGSSETEPNPANYYVCSCVCEFHCAQLLHTILHRIVLIIFPSYPPDNHHCSDDVYLREGGGDRKLSMFYYPPKCTSPVCEVAVVPPAYVRFNGHFPGEPGLTGSAQFSSSTWTSEDKWQRLFTSQMPYLSNNQQCQNGEADWKHWPQPVAWPRPFFIDHQSAYGRCVGPFMPPCNTSTTTITGGSSSGHHHLRRGHCWWL